MAPDGLRRAHYTVSQREACLLIFVWHRQGITRDPATLPISVILEGKIWESPRAGHPFQMGVEIFQNASYEIACV